MMGCKPHRKPGQFHVSVTKFIHEFPHILNFIPFEIQFRRRDRNGSNLKFHTVSICDLVFFHPSISFCHSQTQIITRMNFLFHSTQHRKFLFLLFFNSLHLDPLTKLIQDIGIYCNESVNSSFIKCVTVHSSVSNLNLSTSLFHVTCIVKLVHFKYQSIQTDF